MPLVVTNNAATTLALGVDAAALELVVVDASKFPVLGVGDWAWVTLADLDETVWEICKLTAVVGNTLTVERGLDDTLAAIWPAGANVQCRLTASLLRDLGSSGGSAYTNTTPTPTAIGGIPSGSTFDAQSMTEMWDALLYPEFYPALGAPSSWFSLVQAGYREIGETIAALSFVSSFSRGTISPAYGTSGYRSGLPTGYHYTGTGLSDSVSSAMTDSKSVPDYTVIAGSQSWTSSVSYGAGEQPLSSKGASFGAPLAAGSTSAASVSIVGVYPWFATTAAIATLAQQVLASMASSYVQASMVAEGGTDKQTADFPAAWSAITGIQFYNTVSSAWEWIGGTKANSLATFTASSVVRTVQGASVNYTRFVNNTASIGARLLRFYTT